MTDARTTQVAVEQWVNNKVNAQLTQIAVEQWGSLAVTSGRAIITQIAMEEWASISPPPSKQWATILA